MAIINVHATAAQFAVSNVSPDASTLQGKAAVVNHDHAATLPAVAAAGDSAVPGAAAVRDGQDAAVDINGLAFISPVLSVQPPVDGAAVQVKGHLAPGFHHEGRIAVQGRDGPAGAGNIPDIYNGVAARLIVDGILQALPQTAAQQAGFFAGVLGIADVVGRIVALKEFVGRGALVCIVVIGKFSGGFHAHADRRLVVKLFCECDDLAALQVQVALLATGNDAAVVAAFLLVSGDHRLAVKGDRIPTLQPVHIKAAAQLLRPVAGNLAARHIERSTIDKHAAAMFVLLILAIGHVALNASIAHAKFSAHDIHAAALTGGIVDDRAAVHPECGCLTHTDAATALTCFVFLDGTVIHPKSGSKVVDTLYVYARTINRLI